MMKRILLTMLIGGVCGYIMVSAGFFFNDWKYWGILACMVAMAIVGGSCDEVEEDEDDDECEEEDDL